MIIALGTDHAGFELKETVKKFLEDNEYEVKDFGAHEYKSTDDYPDFISLQLSLFLKMTQWVLFLEDLDKEKQWLQTDIKVLEQ